MKKSKVAILRTSSQTILEDYYNLMNIAGYQDILPKDVDTALKINISWHFTGPFKKMTFASRMQHRIYWGVLKKPIEWSLKTILAPWSYIASVIYHDMFWFPMHQNRVHKILKSEWGRLFQNWEKIKIPSDDLSVIGWNDVGEQPAQLNKQTIKILYQALKILGTCIKEAPEFAGRKRFRKKEYN